MQAFLKNLLFLSILLLLLVFLCNRFLPEKIQSQHAYYLILYFIISTLLIHKAITKAAKKSPQSLIRVYMASTAIRLFTSLIVIVIYGLLFRKQLIGFVLFFLPMYFIFLVFEVASLIKKNKEWTTESLCDKTIPIWDQEMKLKISFST